MNDLERAKKEFFAKNWEAGIAAAKKTNMEDPVLRYFFGYCREHGYGMERNDADAVRTARRGRRRTDGDGCVHPSLWRFPAKRAARELAILSADF